jgi:cyclopropane fatty-acyl-phospholipid synthase-like methyltransferase
MNLENGGERMDINYYNMHYDNFDIYQKSHYKRYEFAKTLLSEDDIVGDMACGSGYGSLMLSENCRKVFGYDIDVPTIDEINRRYDSEKKVQFFCENLLGITEKNLFDKIVSFETVEHFTKSEIESLVNVFHKSLRSSGKLIFSTPYNQKKCEFSIKFHKHFNIDEDEIFNILDGKFLIEKFLYQDYDNHNLVEKISHKDFIICVASKIN